MSKERETEREQVPYYGKEVFLLRFIILMKKHHEFWYVITLGSTTGVVTSLHATPFQSLFRLRSSIADDSLPNVTLRRCQERTDRDAARTAPLARQAHARSALRALEADGRQRHLEAGGAEEDRKEGLERRRPIYNPMIPL